MENKTINIAHKTYKFDKDAFDLMQKTLNEIKKRKLESEESLEISDDLEIRISELLDENTKDIFNKTDVSTIINKIGKFDDIFPKGKKSHTKLILIICSVILLLLLSCVGSSIILAGGIKDGLEKLSEAPGKIIDQITNFVEEREDNFWNRSDDRYEKFNDNNQETMDKFFNEMDEQQEQFNDFSTSTLEQYNQNKIDTLEQFQQLY